jgi:hypothetical protein
MNEQDFASSLRQAQTNSGRVRPGPAASLWDRARRAARVAYRGGGPLGDAQGGYVHDTNVSQYFPPTAALHTVGTWTDTVGNVALTYMKRKTAAGATNQMVYPIVPMQNAIGLKGAYLKSIDLWYEISTANLTSLTPVIDLATLPPGSAATGTAFGAPVAQPFTYDSFHTTAALRYAIGKHHMTLTITTPWWLGPNDLVYLDVAIVDPGTSVYDDYGCRANFTLRM